MKRVHIMAIIAILLVTAFTQAPAWRDVTYHALGITDTLGTGTSADTVYTTWQKVDDYDYVGAAVMITVGSGGGAGGAVVTFQGRTKDLTTYDYLWFRDCADSLNTVQSIALSGTSSLLKTCILSAQPLESMKAETNAADDTDLQLYFDGNILPYTDIRVRIVDTNWNADADITGYWILKRK